MEDELRSAITDAAGNAFVARFSELHVNKVDALLAQRASFSEGPLDEADIVAMVAKLRGAGSDAEKDARWAAGDDGLAAFRLLVILARKKSAMALAQQQEHAATADQLP